MIDFATLQGLTIPEGVVTQITDANGRVLWTLSGDKVILQVEKITSDTYAGEITYTGEQFILLDIYPKTNGTVSVTYGGLTKTITDTSGAEEPNAQQVFFGTFNGVSDSVATPASGKLTFEGDYYAFEAGVFNYEKLGNRAYSGITAIKSFGSTTMIPTAAFGLQIMDEESRCCDKLKQVVIPKTITKIGSNPFHGIGTLNLSCGSGNQHYKVDGNCLIEKETNTLISGFADSVIPAYVTKIGDFAFSGNQELTRLVIPANVTEFGSGTCSACRNLKSVEILATTPPTIMMPPFTTGDEYALSTITVPKGCGDVYKTATSWSTYADYIVEAS